MIDRRAFLKSSGLALLASGLGGCPLFLGRTAQASTGPGLFQRRKTLVCLFQRGAMDGLAAVQPLVDPHLQRVRPALTLSAARNAETRLRDLDGTYGLHPALEPLARFYEEQRLAIVHGVGSPVPTRSHFDAQDYMETGTPGVRGRSGWLNRAVGLAGHEATPFQAVSLTPALPRSLFGPENALSIAKLEDFGLHVRGADLAQTAGQSLEALYEQTTRNLLGEEDALSQAGREGLDAARILQEADLSNYRSENGAEYPRSKLGQSLRQIAQLIKLDVGLEVAFAEQGGWDTHVRQGGTNGSFARQARDLAESLAAFWTDLERHHDEVTVMTMTEFGRTVAQNGARGTDHGRASAMFVLGNGVAGGRVHGRPLVLDPDALEDGRDLPVTTDFRAVFAGVAGPTLGVADDRTLFPDWTGERMRLVG
ncbi:MAG: DUF1501 domain-containing protein [Bacteroidota bacterium]